MKTWLASIVRNRAIDLVRARRESGGDDEAVTTVRDAVVKLPIEQRQAIAIAYFEGRSHSEIAEVTGLSLGTVKSRIRLGMHRLRDLLLHAGVSSPWDDGFAPVAVPVMAGSHPA